MGYKDGLDAGIIISVDEMFCCCEDGGVIFLWFDKDISMSYEVEFPRSRRGICSR